MYSIHNKGKYVVAERFIRTLNTKFCKYVNSMSKNVYIDKLDDTVITHTTEQLRWNLLMLKIIHILIYKKKVNDRGSKFKVGDQNTKIFLLKDTHQIGLKKFL